jgi:hypothetical protein
MPTLPAGCEVLSPAGAEPAARQPAGRGERLPAQGERQRSAEATEVLVASAAGILDFEEFIDSVAFLSNDERNRLKLAGGEIFDNLIRHAPPLEGGSVVLRCARRPGARPVLAFYFRSPVFADFAACSSCGRTEEGTAPDMEAVGPGGPGGQSRTEAEDEMAPFFDPLIGRWRGIGLRMCRNLSASLLLRSGPRMDRIYIAL